MTRLLVAEYLLANTSASRSASTSMLAEAMAMLTAVVADLARAPDTNVTVLLSAASGLQSKFPSNIQIMRGELSAETLRQIPRLDADGLPFDAILLIAPETDGILVSLLKAIQEQTQTPTRSLNLDWRLAQIFADKRSTDSWLRQHHIPTILTKSISDELADKLRDRTFYFRDATQAQSAVLKPRDGAGSENVTIVQVAPDWFQKLPLKNSNEDRWLLQPYVSGIACSVGFIGGGNFSSTTILPPALQSIETCESLMFYRGGQIPCEQEIANRIAPVARRLADAFGLFNGYVGADLIVDCSLPLDSGETVWVVELNPRMCTSYVGYRMLTANNLAIWILQQHAGRQISWNSGTVNFSPM